MGCSVKRKYFSEKMLLGKWELNKDQVNYPTLFFNKDSTAVFSSKGDTIYEFRYSLQDDQLVLKDISNKRTINSITFLDSSKLIFSNLIEYNTRQEYNRKKN